MADNLFALPPSIALRIGVTGHRPSKLPPQSEGPLRATVAGIFGIVSEAARKAEDDYAAGGVGAGKAASKLVVISSLAEGSDRLVAEAGLAANFKLQAVLPFDRAEYVRDFATPGSRARFEQLLADADAVFELPGMANERARAYEAAGFVMLSNIDLLIAIWDGQEAAGIGGTEQIVGHAVAAGLPIVWIDPGNPAAIRLSWSPPAELPPASASARPQEAFRPTSDAAIATAVGQIIALPKKPAAREALQTYVGETERRWNLCPWYSLLLRVFAGRELRRSDFRLPSPLSDTRNQWDEYLKMLPHDRTLHPAIERILVPAFSAADHLAVYYSLVYRSTYVFNFGAAAFAVALALAGMFTGNAWEKSWYVAAELTVIVAILITWHRGNTRQWHRRWLEYRRLADSLRQLRILAPIASEGPVDRPGRKFGVDEEDWVDWYVWSLRRRLPLPDRAVDADYLQAIRRIVRSTEIAEQIRYHIGTPERLGNAQRIEMLDHRLHASGTALLGLTAACCGLFVILVWFGILDRTHSDSEEVRHVFTFLSAVFPTFGAALGAIRVQGDFKTVAEQSKRTAARLAAIDGILAVEPVSFARLADRIEKTSDVMMSDLLEWQTVFRTRPLTPPA
jgi:hypothetical protein